MAKTKVSNPASDSGPTTTDATTRLGILKSRLKIAKTFSKKPHNAWKTWMNEYNIQDWDDTSTIRDKARIGYLFRKTESDIPAIFDDKPDIFIKGRNAPGSLVAPLINGLYDWLWDKQDLDSVIEDVGTYFIVFGMGFVSSPYITQIKLVDQLVQVPIPQAPQQPIPGQMPGQMPAATPPTDGSVSPQTAGVTPQPGQPAAQQQPQFKYVHQDMSVPVIDNPMANAEDPFKLYFSPETQFAPILDYKHCPYYFKEITMTKEEVKAKFGVEVDANETLQVDESPYDDDTIKIDTDPNVEKDDIKRVKVYEYYGCLPEEFAGGITEKKDDEPEGAPEGYNEEEGGEENEPEESPEDEKKEEAWSYDKDYHIFFTMNQELLVEPNPYDVKPLFPVGNYGLANKFWKFGDFKHLMPLIQEKEFYRTAVLRHTRKMANPKPLIPTSTNIDENAFLDPRVGRPVKYDGATPPSYLQPAALGKEVFTGIELVENDLEKVAGSFDLENGGNASTVKTPKGIEVYSAAADKNVERKRKKIARLIKTLITFQFGQIADNWKPEDGKILAITDDGQQTTANVDAEVLQVIGGIKELYTLEIEVESMSVNRALMKQDAIDLFTLAVEHPDVFNVDAMATDLLQNGYGKKDADRYLLTDAQKAALAQTKPEQPKVSVNIKADATTPPGMQLLENEQLIQKNQVADIQNKEQVLATIQNQPLQDAANPNVATPPNDIITGAGNTPMNGGAQ